MPATRIKGIGAGRNIEPAAIATVAAGKGGKNHVKGHAQAIKPVLLTRENSKFWRNKLLTLPMEKLIWDQMIEDGQIIRQFGGLDVFVLSAFCIEATQYFVAARETSNLVQNKEWGKLVHDKGGGYKGPMAASNKAFEKMMTMSVQLGLTPAARARINAIDTQADLFESMMDFGEIGYRIVNPENEDAIEHVA